MPTDPVMPVSPGEPARDVAGSVVAAIFILIAAVGWWDTTTMTDADSYVFPRAVIVSMVVFCLLLIFYNLVRLRPPRGHVAGASNLRRTLLVVLMLAGTALMPVLGFVLSGLIVFGLLMLVAMYDPWTRFRVAVYPVLGAAIVAGFYFLFAHLLLVPLPVGMLFD